MFNSLFFILTVAGAADAGALANSLCNRRLAQSWLEVARTAANDSASFEALQRSCNLGGAEGCSKLATRYGQRLDSARVFAFRVKACNLGRAEDCELAGVQPTPKSSADGGEGTRAGEVADEANAEAPSVAEAVGTPEEELARCGGAPEWPQPIGSRAGGLTAPPLPGPSDAPATDAAHVTDSRAAHQALLRERQELRRTLPSKAFPVVLLAVGGGVATYGGLVAVGSSSGSSYSNGAAVVSICGAVAAALGVALLVNRHGTAARLDTVEAELEFYAVTHPPTAPGAARGDGGTTP